MNESNTIDRVRLAAAIQEAVDELTRRGERQYGDTFDVEEPYLSIMIDAQVGELIGLMSYNLMRFMKLDVTQDRSKVEGLMEFIKAAVYAGVLVGMKASPVVSSSSSNGVQKQVFVFNPKKGEA